MAGIFYFLDWTWLILSPGLVVSIWAQAKVSRTYAAYESVMSSARVTADNFVAVMLRQNGVNDVSVSRTAGRLTDHYDPRRHVIRLSDGVFGSASVAAIAIGGHEAGHALQHAQKYAPLAVRTALVPVVNVVSQLTFPLLLIGILFSFTPFISIAVWAFFAVFVFQLVTLPVELNASKRALANISASHVLTEEEQIGAKKVLNAAAMTYLAAVLTTFLQFVRLLALSRRR